MSDPTVRMPVVDPTPKKQRPVLAIVAIFIALIAIIVAIVALSTNRDVVTVAPGQPQGQAPQAQTPPDRGGRDVAPGQSEAGPPGREGKVEKKDKMERGDGKRDEKGKDPRS